MSIPFLVEIHNCPNFDASHPCRRNSRGDCDSFFPIFSFDHDKPAEMLLRLCERTVSEGQFSISNSYRCCCLYGLESPCNYKMSALPQAFIMVKVLIYKVLCLSFGLRPQVIRFTIDETHIFHVQTPYLFQMYFHEIVVRRRPKSTEFEICTLFEFIEQIHNPSRPTTRRKPTLERPYSDSCPEIRLDVGEEGGES